MRTAERTAMKPLQRNLARAGRRGFSLAELMVVIVILGLLATIVVPNVMSRLRTAQATAAKVDLGAISQAVELYAIENGGRYPESLEVLILEDENGKSYLKGYETVPEDPWGHEYQYDPGSGRSDFEVFTLGADGQRGGEGDDADLSSKDLKKRR